MKKRIYVSLLFLPVVAVILYYIGVSRAGEEFGGPVRFKKEAELVLRHFEKEGDSLKILAAKFILANARFHFFFRTVFIDTLGNEVSFNVYDYKNRMEIQLKIDSIGIQAKQKMLAYKVWDVDLLKADEMIENIDLAFSVWRSRPWARRVTFDDFCEYILPYRAYNEPLEDWRGKLTMQYDWLVDSVAHSSNAVEACGLINTSLSSWLEFDWDRGGRAFNNQSIGELMQSKHGKCSDLVTMAACAMRSQGIPVAIDYVPHWAHRNSGHSWNVVLLEGGRTVDFAGAETNPGYFHAIQPFCKVGKIFRETFGSQAESLAAIKDRDDVVPSFLNKFNLKDVTKDYVSVGDINLFGLKPPKGAKFVYLCTYNSGIWKPIYWSQIVDDKATFKEMDDNDVLYLPAYFQSKQILPAGLPFIFSRDHSIRFLRRTDSLNTVELKFYNKFYDEKLLEGFFQENVKYSLSYWDGYWKRIGTQQAGKGQTLMFSRVPVNSLLRIESLSLSNIYQRPFFMKNGEQIFL